MKRAKAKISIELFKRILKLPFGVELISATYEANSDHLDIILEGEPLPIKHKTGAGKGRLPEINYDPRPTWTVAGMSVKEKSNGKGI